MLASLKVLGIYSAIVRSEEEQRRLLYTPVLMKMGNFHPAHMNLILHNNFQRGVAICAEIHLPICMYFITFLNYSSYRES